jgi:hypothetical protein
VRNGANLKQTDWRDVCVLCLKKFRTFWYVLYEMSSNSYRLRKQNPSIPLDLRGNNDKIFKIIVSDIVCGDFD